MTTLTSLFKNIRILGKTVHFWGGMGERSSANFHLGSYKSDRSGLNTFLLAVVTCMALSSGIALADDNTVLDSEAASYTKKGVSLNAKSAVLVDYSTGQIMFSKDSDMRMVPSSMTKMMTVYLAFKQMQMGKLSLDESFPVSERAYSAEGSKMFVELNSTVSVEDLLRGIIVSSANDGCIVLAEGISGDEDAFAELMQSEAGRIGMRDTLFLNSTGLPEPGHISTSNDLAVLAISLIKDFPDYYPYHAEKEFTYNNIKQFNRNSLLGKYGIDGIKTGHTEEGGYGLAASAVKDGWRLVSVVNGAENINAREVDTQKLLARGFNFFEIRKLYNKGEKIGEVTVRYGNKEKMDLLLADDVNVIIPKGSEPDLSRIAVYYDKEIKAPITKGQELGFIEIDLPYINGKKKVIQVVAMDEVGESGFLMKLWQKIMYFFSEILNKFRN